MSTIGFVVTLDRDFGEEGTKRFVDAVMMIKGVVGCTPVNSNPWNDNIVELRVKDRIRNELREALYEATK